MVTVYRGHRLTPGLTPCSSCAQKLLENNSLVGGRTRAEARTTATERVIHYCTWRPSALTARPHGQVFVQQCICYLCLECSDLCAGLIGGLGVTPSGNIGETGAIFESVSTSGHALSYCIVLSVHAICIIRSTPLSRHNKVGLKYPSIRLYVRPSTKSFLNFNEIWYVGG